MEKIYDVIIMGSGISGLSAAYEAKQKKLKYLVIEANHRTGGRVFSKILKNKLAIELGAEWLGKNHKNIINFCKKYDIKLEKHRYASPRYFFENGTEYIEFADFLDKFDKKISKYKFEKIPEEKNWYTFLSGDFNEDELKIITKVYAPDFGTHIRYVSAREAFRETKTGGEYDHMDYHVIGGNKKIIDTLIKNIGKRNVKTSEPIIKIKDERGFVEVTTAKKIYYARKVIVSSSTQALKKVKIKPSLLNKKEVANDLSYVDISKTFIFGKCDKPLKKQDFAMYSNSELPYIYLATQGQSDTRLAFCVYSVGKQAKKVHKMSLAKLKKEFKKILPEDLFAENNFHIEGAVSQNWSSENYIGGAYGLFNPNELNRIRDTFSKPHGNIYFSGGHLGQLESFMEGAFQSGRDTLKIIYQDLKSKK